MLNTTKYASQKRVLALLLGSALFFAGCSANSQPADSSAASASSESRTAMALKEQPSYKAVSYLTDTIEEATGDFEEKVAEELKPEETEPAEEEKTAKIESGAKESVAPAEASPSEASQTPAPAAETPASTQETASITPQVQTPAEPAAPAAPATPAADSQPAPAAEPAPAQTQNVTVVTEEQTNEPAAQMADPAAAAAADDGIWHISYVNSRGTADAPFDGSIGLWADGWFIAHNNMPNGDKIATMPQRVEVDGKTYHLSDSWIGNDSITPEELARIRANNGITFQTCQTDSTNYMVHYDPDGEGYNYQFAHFPYTVNDDSTIGYYPEDYAS